MERTMNRRRNWVLQRWSSVKRRSRLAAEFLERAGRRALLAAGIPNTKEFLVLRGSERNDLCGLFSELAAVLGLLEHYEEWNDIYSGLRVDFADQGLYYDPARGENWWEYYFEPIDVGRPAHAIARIVTSFQHENLACAIHRLSRRRGFSLIDRYIHPQRHIRDMVNTYVRDNFRDNFVFGVHYRGTDKWMDAPRVPYSEIPAAIQRVAASVTNRRYAVFVATDERAFLDYMTGVYPGRILYRPMFRSADGRPIDVVNEDANYKKGEDAVIDCLLLSRCQYLVRTASNLSLCSTLFNPSLTEIALNCQG
jgi:hypothetical protein